MSPFDVPVLVVPQQKYPVIDASNLCQQTWYLFFAAIKSAITVLGANLNAAVATIPLLMVSGTQSQLVALKKTLVIGQLVNVTDYGHVLQWNGANYVWGPGEAGSGMMQLFEVDPTGVGWHLYDGTTVTYLKSDGTTGSIALPDLTSVTADAAYPKAGSPNGGPNAATAPTFSGGSISAAATGVSASTSGPSATVNVLSSSVTSVATGTHGHAVFISDPTHTHSLGSGSVGSDGEPRNIVRRPWFRI